MEVTADQIEVNLLCPICNHRSLVSVTTKKEAEIANDRIKRSFEQKLADWNFSGKVGPRPRMAKTQSQVLGCVCYLQNCIGNKDGTGCFKCKSMKEEMVMTQDKR